MSKDISEKEFSNEGFTVWGSADRNGNKSADGCFASADCCQLVDSETVLIGRTSGDRLIIVYAVFIAVRVVVDSDRTAEGVM